VADRRPCQQRQGGVVVDLTVDEDAAVSVIGVLTGAHVGDDEDVREPILDRGHGSLDDAVLVPRTGRLGVLHRRNAEEQHPGHSDCLQLSDLDQQGVDGELRLPGHGSDRVADALPFHHEQRGDHVARLQVMLAHELAQRWRHAGTPRPDDVIHAHALSIDRWIAPAGASPHKYLARASTIACAPGMSGVAWTGRPRRRIASAVTDPIATKVAPDIAGNRLPNWATKPSTA